MLLAWWRWGLVYRVRTAVGPQTGAGGDVILEYDTAGLYDEEVAA